MKPVHRRLRVPLLCAALLWSLVGAAGAEGVPYLMYVRGSEGPPATPMRVLWDVLEGLPCSNNTAWTLHAWPSPVRACPYRATCAWGMRRSN